jgi:hypothetical protein
MKNNALISIVTAIAIMLFASCKKEDPNTIHVPAPPGPPTTSQVSSVQLNGGIFSGRWTMTFEQSVTMRNDTLQYFDTTTQVPGMYIVEFAGNLLYIIDTTVPDTSIYTFTANGNQITLEDGVDDIIIRYGVSQQGVMRWYLTDTYVSGNNIYEYHDDYLFERY